MKEPAANVPNAPYNNNATYSTGDTVTFNAVVYKSLVAGNIGHQPASSPTQWATSHPAKAQPHVAPPALNSPPPNTVGTLDDRMSKQEENMRAFYDRLGACEAALQNIHSATTNHKPVK